MAKYKKEELVIVDYNDLVQEDKSDTLFPLLSKAFGREDTEALGAIAIRNVPNFVHWKDRCLPMAHTLANLDPSYLEEELTDPSSLYNAGWSRGKEALSSESGYGSFYYNPITDQPGTEEDRRQYPASYPCNKWPNDESILPGFQEAAKTLGTIMKEATVQLSRHIDAYAKHHCPQYPHQFLYNSIQHTEKVKGRLLYYYPNKDTATDWIGWHNDSGFLTALAGDLYIHHTTGQTNVVVNDDDAGLLVKNRKGDIVKVLIPQDCMAVQIGECVQIITGGAVQATSHSVQTLKNHPNIARISHPCFIDTIPSFPLSLPPGTNREDVIQVDDIVPPLSDRWTHDGMTFGNFLQTTFEKYYQWSTKS